MATTCDVGSLVADVPVMRRLAIAAVSILALGIMPACAGEEEEDIESSDAALAADWAEFDEDATPLTQQEKAEALGDDEDDVELLAAEETEEAEEASAEITAPPPLP